MQKSPVKALRSRSSLLPLAPGMSQHNPVHLCRHANFCDANPPVDLVAALSFSLTGARGDRPHANVSDESVPPLELGAASNAAVAAAQASSHVPA